MASRPRQRSRRNWPDYLTARNRAAGPYYSWKDPRTGQEYGLGFDFAEAAAQAREANIKIAIEAEQAAKFSLTDRLEQRDTRTIAAWIDEFEKILLKRKGRKGTERAASTIELNKGYCKVLRGHFGDKLIAHVTTAHCADLIRSYSDQGKDRSAVAIRFFMIDCFAEAEAAGWIERGHNPADITRVEVPTTQRARLELPQFLHLWKHIKEHGEPWLETAALLGLLSGQRLGDVCKATFADARDGHLHVEQDKCDYRVRIPLDLGLPEIGLTVGKVIKTAKRTGIVGAATIVHHQQRKSGPAKGDRISSKHVSRRFTEALRATFPKPEKEWPGKKPPTFHELRSLAKRLYAAHGVDTKTLLGHEDDKTAAMYADPRGGWNTVAIPAAK